MVFLHLRVSPKRTGKENLYPFSMVRELDECQAAADFMVPMRLLSNLMLPVKKMPTLHPAKVSIFTTFQSKKMPRWTTFGARWLERRREELASRTSCRETESYK